MKTWLVLPIAAMLLISVIPSYEIFADRPENPGKSNERPPISVEDLTQPKSITLPDGTIVDRVVHIFYEKDFVKPDNPGGGKGNGGGKDKTPQESDCYSFTGASWKSVEPYYVDPRNSGLTDEFVAEKVSISINDWESYANHDIFGTGTVSEVDGIDTQSTDGLNELVFDEFSDPRVIAVTISWMSRVGPPSDRPMVEWDMLFNIKDYTFGDAQLDSSFMDFHAIAAHEIGHAAGMDHTDTTELCSAQTMYPTAGYGETNKRTLEIGDQTGIFKRYN